MTPTQITPGTRHATNAFARKKEGTQFVSAIILLALLFSCKKQQEPFNPVAESEKLTIPAAVDLPANLPFGNTRLATYYAEGVQKYKAQVKAGSNPVSFEWVFVAPQASLYDAHNKKVGSHGAGPVWKLFTSDSVHAQAYNPPKSSPATNASDIDWLLLQPRPGKTPSGVFSGVSYIQRIATKGGRAPQTAPSAVTDTIDVPYTAVYRFSKAN